jgi:hypothetical protein
MRVAHLLSGAMLSLGVAACSAGPAAAPTAEVFKALHVVNNGPYPLYANVDDWVAARPTGLAPAQAEKQTIQAGRVARAQHRVGADEGAWLLKGCIFDVRATSSDHQEASYVWAYGRVVRCDEPVEDGVVEPQMGVRPEKLRIYDGQVGYFPMSLLDPYTGSAPAPRQ